MYLQFLNVALLESFPNPMNQALRSIYQPCKKCDKFIDPLEADKQLLAMHSPETSDSDVDIAKHKSTNATDLQRSST